MKISWAFIATVCLVDVIQMLAVGGEEVEENPYPWMAALGSSDPDSGRVTWFCGGTNFGHNFVVTAAHCVSDPDSGLTLDLVRLGAYNLALETEAAADDYQVRTVIVHPDYEVTGKILLHDIAILILDTPTVEKIKYINMGIPGSGFSDRLLPPLPAGSEIVLAGWGASMEPGVTAGKLHEFSVEVMEAGRCKRLYREALGVELPDTILCADIEAGGKDACQGDSGAGLVYREMDDWWTWTGPVGVASAGTGCGAGLPSLYTELRLYFRWIIGVTETSRTTTNHFMNGTTITTSVTKSVSIGDRGHDWPHAFTRLWPHDTR